MLTTRDIPNVEILSVGTWPGTGCPPGGCAFNESDLDELVAAYEATKHAVHLPLKLGHDDKQKLLQSDGYPAAGWLTNVRRVGEKLIGDLSKVPAKIADLMDAGAYRDRSVEIETVEFEGRKFPQALTGMALLGADLPAVQNLADIMSWYSRQFERESDAAARIVFTGPPSAEDAGRKLTTYVDNAEHVLTDVQAFALRTGELVALRAKDGRSISEGHRERLTSLRDGLSDIKAKLDTYLEEAKPPEEPQDYARVMRARLRIAELRQAELIGA